MPANLQFDKPRGGLLKSITSDVRQKNDGEMPP